MLNQYSAAQLVAVHNLFAVAPVKKFENASVARRRTADVIELSGITVEAALVKAGLIEAPAPVVVVVEAPLPPIKPRKDRSRLVKVAPPVPPAAANPRSKSATAVVPTEQQRVVIALAARPEGTTNAEVLKATGWTACPVRRYCEKLAAKFGYGFQYVARTPETPTSYRLLPR